MKKFIFLLIVVFFLLGVSIQKRFNEIQNKTNPDTIVKIQEKNGIPVEVCSPVIIKDMVRRMNFYGTVTPFQKTTVSGKINEMIVKSFAKIGKYVEKDETVFLLDNIMPEIQVKLALASVKQAKAGLEKLLTGSRPQEIKQAQANLKSAEAQYKNATEEVERMRNLKKSGAIPQQKADSILAMHKSAGAALEAAKQQLSLVQEGARNEDILAVEAMYEQACAKLKQAETNLEYTKITAPFSGYISEIFREEGEMFPMQSKTLFTIVDIEKVYLDAEISEIYINSIVKGMSVECFTPNIPHKKYIGIIDEISPVTISGTRIYPVRILIENSDHQIKPGMFFKAVLELERKEQVIAIDQECIITKGERSFVYTVEENTASLTEVFLGIEENGYSELININDLNTKIVFKGQNNLTDGMKVLRGVQ